MNNIKTYIIGFLSATCLFLFMGATDGVDSMDWNVTGEVTVEDIEGNLIIKASENGRYQISTAMKGNSPNVRETII